MFESDTIVLTGAGASIPVGIPGMIGLAREFASELSAESPEAKALARLRDLGTPEDVEEILQLSNGIVNLPGGRVQRFLEVCVAPRGGVEQLGRFKSRLEEEVAAVAKMREELLEYIVRRCLSFDRANAEELYGPWLRKVVDRRFPVFTTNYDTVFDHVAEASGIPVLDNFVADSTGRRFFWDSTLQAFQGEGLQLVKIHGCIQWYATEVGRIERIPVLAVRNEEGETLERLMIFPTRFKDIFQQNYFPLYAAFTRSLARARILLVIGHSLRDEYLLAAIRERLREPDFDVVVIAPGFRMKTHLMADVRKGNSVTHMKREIQTVMPLLLQVLDGSFAADVAAHLRQANSRMSRGEKDKVRITSLPQWVNRGERVSGVMELDTINVHAHVRAWLEPNKNRKNRIKVNPTFDGKGPGRGTVIGMIAEETKVSFRMPKELEPGRHRLVVALQRDDGTEAARTEYIVGVRKS